MTWPRLDFPNGKKFAFTVFDDTDVATVENVRPIYRLFEQLGMRTTKTVWPVACPEGSPNFSTSETMDDEAYRAFVIDLARRGFEIASHGATMESSERARTVTAWERFRADFGRYPRLHANHSYNRENVYWGVDRLDEPLVRALYRRVNGRPSGHYQGHHPQSPYWWGDLLTEHVEYTRNLTFAEINLLRINPSMPYHDPSRPLVRWWFSSADAEGAEEFNRLLRDEEQARLEREGGICIVATHLGKGYHVAGEVHPGTRAVLEQLALRSGWFPTVGELLDWMRDQRSDQGLPPAEWRAMQWRWFRDLAWRKVVDRGRRVLAGRW